MSVQIRRLCRNRVIFTVLVFLFAATVFRFSIYIMNRTENGGISARERLNVIRQMDIDSIEKLKSDKRYKEMAEEILAQFMDDAVCFPVPISTRDPRRFVNYADSWGYGRSYGGERTHEGTDIMADYNVRGYYPVVSISDGIVEKIGWLELGGYRLGIRCKSGGYFYYAHLYDYAEGINEGSQVKAGQLIGYMGDSGYSKVEGTVGNFDVHLHLGIYVMYEGEELSVNPFHLLKRLQIIKANY